MEITVIIPTYRPKEYIFECLTALKKQSLKKEEFEILIILNGEKEPYYNDIYKFLIQERIENVKLLYTGEKGVSNARNLGLDRAKGNYIAFIDDDDYVDNNYLEVMLGTLKNKKKSICCANYKNFDENTRAQLKTTDYLWGDITDKIEKYRRVFSSIGAKLIPIDVIQNIRFDINLKNSEDALFMTLISKNIKKICIANQETYYNRRVRAFSANMKKKSLNEVIYVFIKLLKQHLKLLFKANYRKKFILLRMLAIVKGTYVQLKKV